MWTMISGLAKIKEKSDKQLIRNMMESLFPEDTFWISKNANAILKEHEFKLKACLSKFKNKNF